MSDERKTAQRRAMGQFSAEVEDGVGTTIVGGQPPRQPRAMVKIAAGVEKLLYLAANDDELRAALLADRATALERCGVSLSDSERAMLISTPAAQLEATINALDIRPQNVERRRFLRAVAASAAAVTVGAAAACGDDSDSKIDMGTDSWRVADGISIDDMPHDAPGDVTVPQPDISPVDGIRPGPDRGVDGNKDVAVDLPPAVADGVRPDLSRPDTSGDS
jgi:hypothetical protein